jgi:hypothetical protein
MKKYPEKIEKFFDKRGNNIDGVNIEEVIL